MVSEALPGFQGCKSNQRCLCMLSAISDLYNQHFFLEMSFSAPLSIVSNILGIIFHV